MSFQNTITQDFVFILKKSLCNHFRINDENKIHRLICNGLEMLNAEIVSCSFHQHQHQNNDPEKNDYPYICHNDDHDDDEYSRKPCPRRGGQGCCSFNDCKICN